jgi:hypothetical protein
MEDDIACERSDANIRQPFPTRARQPVRASAARDSRQVFGLMGFGWFADLLGAASQA